MSPQAELGVGPDATVDEVKQAWRRLVAIHHPDRGGDASVFDRLKKAYQLALAEASVCRHCQGLGRVPVQSGWSTVMVVCPGCGGESSGG